MRRIWTAKARVAVRCFISSVAADLVEAADCDLSRIDVRFERSGSGVLVELVFRRTGLDIERFVEARMASSRS